MGDCNDPTGGVGAGRVGCIELCFAGDCGAAGIVVMNVLKNKFSHGVCRNEKLPDDYPRSTWREGGPELSSWVEL